MAGVTFQPIVRSRERKSRLFVVIEAPARPSIRIVAVCAVRAEAAGMKHILVASRTIAWRVLEGRGAVAFLAGDGGVQADERKASEIVIERDFLAPTHLVVALAATIAELPLVRVVFLMAARACHRQFGLVDIAFVAGITLDRRVLALERKFRRFGMIEMHDLPGLG